MSNDSETSEVVSGLKPAKNRLTVTRTVYYEMQTAGVNPISVASTFSREVRSDSEPYERRVLRVGEDWERLPLGFLKGKDIGHVVIQNREGKNLQLRPTLEEQEEISNRILVIQLSLNLPIGSCGWFVHPGESFEGSPYYGFGIWIRCLSGEAQYSLLVIPK